MKVLAVELRSQALKSAAIFTFGNSYLSMGFLFLEAVTRADVPLITTYLVAVGFLFVVTNTLADVVSLWLDPRISLEGRR